MPFAYPDKWGLARRVVARVREGETLGAIGREAGMPSEWTVLAWARGNAPFREELSAAMRRGAWRRVYAFDEAKAAALLVRLRAGAGVHDVVGTPGMPSWASYRYWKLMQAPFAEALFHVRQGRVQAWGAKWRKRRDYTRELGDRVLAKLWMGVPAKRLRAADPALPGYKTLLRWRREQPAFDRLVRGMLAAWRTKHQTRNVARRCTPEMTEWVWGKILEGGSLSSIGDEPGAPTRATLSRWVRTRPEFAAAVAEACVDREDWFNDHIDEIEKAMAPGMTVAELKAIRARSAPYRRRLAQLRWWAQRGLPSP